MASTEEMFAKQIQLYVIFLPIEIYVKFTQALNTANL